MVDLFIVPTCSNNQVVDLSILPTTTKQIKNQHQHQQPPTRFFKRSTRRLPGILLFLRRHELHHLHRDAGLLRVDGAAGRAQRLHPWQRRHVAQAQQGEVERGLAQATQVVPLVVGLLAALGPEILRKLGEKHGKTLDNLHS